MSKHGDFVLIQQNTAWEDFVNGTDGESQTRTDLINQVKLARQNNIEYIFVIGALNGLNRREFIGLTIGWEASFATPDVRSAYRNYALWVVRTFHPHYLGLASEINTYMDAHPDDGGNFVSVYNEIYSLVNAEAPETSIFVSFQWDDLNNMFPQPGEGDRQRLQPNWEQVQAFEPNLDVVEDADLHVRLNGIEAGRREVEEREVVLAGKVLDLCGDRLEPSVDRMLGTREVLEERRELAKEAGGVHGRAS